MVAHRVIWGFVWNPFFVDGEGGACKIGITPVIPGKRGRKRKIRHDRPRYRERRRIEAIFNRLKDFRRIATRYDKLARNYASALALAAVIAFWC